MSEKLFDRWRQVIGRDMPYYIAKISEPWTLETLVEISLDLRAYDYDLSLAREYARRTVEELNRALFEAKSFEQLHGSETSADETTRQFLTKSRKAPIVRGLAYAKAAASGEWDLPLLREAGNTYEEALSHVSAKTWMHPDQWRLHSAVMLALECGDVAHAAKLLESKRKFKDTQSFHDVLVFVVERLAANDGKIAAGSPEATKIQEVFDLLRQPERDAANKAFGMNVVNDLAVRRFEFAVLRERYLLGNTGVPDWPRVFRSMSE